jgi:hypothetical protein
LVLAAHHHHPQREREGERKRERWLQGQKWWVLMDMDAARKDQVMLAHLKPCLVQESHLFMSLVFTLVIVVVVNFIYFSFPLFVLVVVFVCLILFLWSFLKFPSWWMRVVFLVSFSGKIWLWLQILISSVYLHTVTKISVLCDFFPFNFLGYDLWSS